MIFPWLEQPWRVLLRQRERLHHAVLIHGPGGIGKSALAGELARALLCEDTAADGAACGGCASCRWIGQGTHPDLRVLAPASGDESADVSGDLSGNLSQDVSGGGKTAKTPAKASRDIRIDQVRALERFLEVGGHRGGDKVVLVDPADALNAASANALLKTLEEPTGRTRFVLVADRPDVLPATIRSRCLAVGLCLPDAAQAARWLAEETGADPATASGWLAACGGAPLRARRFADPSAASAHRLLMETLAGLPETGIVRAADALAGIEPPVWIGALQTWIADLQRVCAGAEPRFFPDRAARLRSLSRMTSLHAVDRLAVQLSQLARAADHPLNPRLMIEDALLRVRAALAG